MLRDYIPVHAEFIGVLGSFRNMEDASSTWRVARSYADRQPSAARSPVRPVRIYFWMHRPYRKSDREMTSSLITPVIICGGTGTRLWPLSRESQPKQFFPLAGGASTFQQVLTRVADPRHFWSADRSN